MTCQLKMLSALANADIVPRSMARSTQDAIAMCNRAIHGEDIRGQDARSLIEAGTALLSELTRYANELDRISLSRENERRAVRKSNEQPTASGALGSGLS
jgi:hypothetical protein